MSSLQSEIPALAQKLESSFHMEMLQLIETEMVQLLDLKYKDMSAVIMSKFKVLMENMDLMVEDIRESLKNDLKEILGVKSTMLEMKNAKDPNTRKELQQIKDTTSMKRELVEEIGEHPIENIENITFKRSEIGKLSSKLDQSEDYTTNQGKKLSPDNSQNHKVLENMEEAIGITDDTGRNCNIHIEVTGEDEGQEHEEDVLGKGTREENIPQNFKNKEKVLKPSKEDGGILTLAADFSSATLDVSKQWSNVFNILRENYFEPKILCQVKLAFKCDGEIRTFSDMQSLRKFISQKSFMKELLKGAFPEKENRKRGGRRYGIQEKMNKTLIASKHGSVAATSDGLSFLFIKEVKVAETEEVKSLETHEEEAAESKEKEALEEDEASEPEKEEKETLDLEEEEESSQLEEEGEISELEEEEEEDSELEQGEESSGLEEEKDSVLSKEQNSILQYYSMARGVELNSEELDSILAEEEKCYELQEGDSSEWERELFLPWPEGEDSEEETTSQTEEEEASLKELSCTYLASDSKKKKLVKRKLTSKETELLQETEENFRRSVINSFRKIQEEIRDIKNYRPGNKKLSKLSARIEILREKVNNLEDQIEEFSKETRQMAKQIREVEDRSRSSNIRLIGVPEKDNKENGAEDIVKEIIEENFGELKKRSDLDIVTAFRIPSKIDENRPTSRHILVKFGNSSDREKILTASREKKEVTYRGRSIRMIPEVSLDTLDARSQWGSIRRGL